MQSQFHPPPRGRMIYTYPEGQFVRACLTSDVFIYNLHLKYRHMQLHYILIIGMEAYFLIAWIIYCYKGF